MTEYEIAFSIMPYVETYGRKKNGMCLNPRMVYNLSPLCQTWKNTKYKSNSGYVKASYDSKKILKARS